MPISRLPLTSAIESRSASLAKDSYTKNGYFEVRDQRKEFVKRSGCSVFAVTGSAPQPGQAQGLYTFNDKLWAVTNNTLYSITTAGVGTAYTPLLAGTVATVSFNQTSTRPYMTLHNKTNFYTYDQDTDTLAHNTQFAAIQAALTIAGYSSALASGIVYLDGFTFLMTTDGRIYNSAVEDPTTWNALNYITAEAEPDGGTAIIKHFNYLVAFGTWSTEFFYDGAGSSGYVAGTSPLFRNDSARLEIGCVNGGSVVQVEQSVVWVGMSKLHGKSVYMLDGLSPIKVSTPYIEKFLNADQADDIVAYSYKIEGHTFYIMTLHSSDLTFVYDLDQKIWYNWTTSAATPAGGTAVVGQAIAGIAVVGNNGNQPSSVAEHYYRQTFFTMFNVGYYTMDDDLGTIYVHSPTVYEDAVSGGVGQVIYYKCITSIQDSGTTKRKFYRRIEVVGDKCAGTLYIRHSDNDYASWSSYRNILLSNSRAQLFTCGSARRRAWELSCQDNVPLRIEALEIDFDIGELEGASN